MKEAYRDGATENKPNQKTNLTETDQIMIKQNRNTNSHTSQTRADVRRIAPQQTLAIARVNP